MKLAVNYSREAAGLVAAGKIPLDRFKSPDWPDLVAEASRYKPVAVHFDLEAGSGRLNETDWEQVAQLREATGTPYVNLHLAARSADYPDFPIHTIQPEHRKAILAGMLKDVQAAAERFGADQIIVENAPFHKADDRLLQPCVEPDIIHRVVTETGAGLLLDISHARIAAHSIGMPEREYMQALPVERVRELHFTGLHRLNGRLSDHLPILETDWPVLRWVLEQVEAGKWGQPWMLAFEYGGVGEKFESRSDPAVMAEQIPRLYGMVHSI